MVTDLGDGGLDFGGMGPPAQTTEEYAQAALNFGQVDPPGFLVGIRGGVQAAGIGVPDLADGLFRFKNVEFALGHGCSPPAHFVGPCEICCGGAGGSGSGGSRPPATGILGLTRRQP